MDDFETLRGRDLAEDEVADAPPPAAWEPILTIVILVVMFGVLILDRVGTDSVMLTALMCFYVTGIISIEETLKGFNSQGLLTVLVLFVVAEGLNKTGALNWYVGKLFGRPTTLTGAQLRVMVPITLLSGFINDTPLVTIALPIVIQWAKQINVSTRFLLIPLSFAALLGGTCTIIGTSTNLIVQGLLIDRYPDVKELSQMSIFAITIYGVPVAMIGVAYIVLMTPVLLVRNDRHRALAAGVGGGVSDEDILLGARVTQWSPAAGRTIKRSGLRDTGGIYLVSVRRRATGNVHTAVSPEFVLEVDDILYFTGMIDTFGDFCEEHGLEVVTNEVEMELPCVDDETEENTLLSAAKSTDSSIMSPLNGPPRLNVTPTSPSHEDMLERQTRGKLKGLGITLDSLLDSTLKERMRVVFSMEDFIREESTSSYETTMHPSTSRVVVATHDDLVIIAIDAPDRSGLLLDISKCLSRLQLDLRHTEAAVRSNSRSLSIWRCQASSERAVTEEYMSEVWTVVQTLLSDGKGIEATRVRGLQVMRARVREGSRLSGLMLSEVTDFRDRYKAAVLAIQKVDGQVHTESVSTIMLDVGDVLVLQVAEDSPLLESPPQDCQVQESKRLSISLFRRMSQTKHSDEEISQSPMSDVEDAGVSKETLAAWSDLEATKSQTDGGGVKREFLTAMAIGDGSGLAGRTVAQSGIDKLPGTFLVSIERPHVVPESHPPVDSFKTIPFTEALEAGDVLWFSGAASDVGDLRKIPGLILYDSGEVNKMNEKAQNRRLVEAVVSRNGSLVGRTAKDVKFRANYGAAVISVSREGKRVHELPGNIKFHAGDVLLLEAGKTFMDANKNNQCDAFTLISVVQDSSPPRFRMLFPAVFLTVAAYVCYMVKWPVPTLFGTAMVAAILMVMLGVLSEAEARAAIRWEIYLTIAPAFGVGQALINSGVAETMANFFVSVSDKMNIGDAGLLGAIYFATVLMSQVVANNAAAALIFPIAMDAAEKVGIDLEIMSFAIMLAASAAFMTPFGYQTNLMVMGPGGYSTGDFLILGTPMQLVLTVVTTISLVTPTRWYLVWLVSLAVLICVSLFRYLSERKRGLGKRY